MTPSRGLIGRSCPSLGVAGCRPPLLGTRRYHDVHTCCWDVLVHAFLMMCRFHALLFDCLIAGGSSWPSNRAVRQVLRQMLVYSIVVENWSERHRLSCLELVGIASTVILDLDLSTAGTEPRRSVPTLPHEGRATTTSTQLSFPGIGT